MFVFVCGIRLKQDIYIALLPPIVEDTHMKIQYSEQNKKKEKLYYIHYLNTMCVLSVQGCRLNTDMKWVTHYSFKIYFVVVHGVPFAKNDWLSNFWNVNQT